MNRALLRDNPGLLVTTLLLALGTGVFVAFGLITGGDGGALRGLIFVAGMFLLVVLPQFAFHLGTATGAIPRRNLTWMPAADQARVYGWLENEPALAVRDGKFADLAAVFGAGVDPALGADLRASGATSRFAAGAPSPFAAAEAAHMAVLPPEGSAIVARFAEAAAAEAAARDYARQALGFWPETDSDGLRSATRPAGDVVKIACVGRTLAIVSGPSERGLMKRLLALGAIAPAKAPSDPGSERYWLFRPGVLPALLVAMALLYVFAFFKGASWAGSVGAVDGVEPLDPYELQRRLLAIDTPDVPFSISRDGAQRLVATWRFADARWLDLARAHRMKYDQRVILDLDPASHRVRVTEQRTTFDASAGRGGAALEWRTMRGVTFFHTERGRVFGLQFDAEGKPMPDLDYEWRFDAREMKAPLIDVVTKAGWQWRPTPWSGPRWLRWLTD